MVEILDSARDLGRWVFGDPVARPCGPTQKLKYTLVKPLQHLCFERDSWGEVARLYLDAISRVAKTCEPILLSLGMIGTVTAIKPLKWPGVVLVVVKGWQYMLNADWRDDEHDVRKYFFMFICPAGMIINGHLALDRLFFNSYLTNLIGLKPWQVGAFNFVGNLSGAANAAFGVWHKQKLVDKYRGQNLADDVIKPLQREIVDNGLDVWKFGWDFLEQFLVDYLPYAYPLPLPFLWIMMTVGRFSNFYKSARELERYHTERPDRTFSDVTLSAYRGICQSA